MLPQSDKQLDQSKNDTGLQHYRVTPNAVEYSELDFSSPVISAPAVEIEEGVLGAILLDPEALALVEDLPVEAFEVESHQRIYRQMLKLHAEGYKPDLLTLKLKLSDLGILEAIGGTSKLTQLFDRCVHSYDLPQHAQTLKQRLEDRALNKELSRISKLPPQEKRNQLDQLNQQVKQKGTNNPDERLKLELQALLQESDLIRKARRKAEICSFYRLGSAIVDGLLKDLDQQTRTVQSRFMGLDELFDLPQTGIDYLIPGMLPVGETVLLVADPKTGKSLLAYDAAFAVATGEDTFLGEVCRSGKVLIIQTDESVGTAKGRLLKRGFRREDAANVRFMDSFNISQLAELEKQVEDFRPSLVIIDSLRRINAGHEVSENSAEFSDNVYKLKEIVTRYGASAILIHHCNKNSEAVGVGRVRGSSAIAGAVWGVWQLDHIPKPDPNNKKRRIIDPKDPTRILSITARDIEGQRLKIELDPENNHWINHSEESISAGEAQERKTHEGRILELLQGIAPTGLEAQEINERLGIGKGIYSVLNRLLGKRLIGSRPSATDRRRTVYFCSKDPSKDGDTPPPVVVDSSQFYPLPKDPSKGGDTPPPPPCDPIVIECPETHTTYGVQRSITNLSQTYHKPITRLDLEPSVTTSDVELASVVEVDHKLVTQGGGEGVEDSEKVKESELINEQQYQIKPSKILLKVGSRVALADPYMVAYKYHGTVERVIESSAEVVWMERCGKVGEREVYDFSELRLLD